MLLMKSVNPTFQNLAETHNDNGKYYQQASENVITLV